MTPETTARIAELCALAAGQGDWRAALDAVTAAVGGTGATLEAFDLSSGSLTFFASSAGMPGDSDARYLAEFAAVNPRLPPASRLTRGESVVDHDFISEVEMDHHPFYADFLAPFDLR